MTYKELKQYVEDQRKAKAAVWAKQKEIHGECQPITAEEYNKYQEIIITGKKAYKTKFVHNKLWKDE